MEYFALMVGIVAQVYFLKQAVNRDYRGVNGNFRLSAHEIENPANSSQSGDTQESDGNM